MMGAAPRSAVTVTVPATVANLGPGFDCLGVAVGKHLEVAFSREEPADALAVPPAPKVPVGHELTHRAFVTAFAAAGEAAPEVRMSLVRSYAHARGLGASASAIVAGLAAARALGGLGLTDTELARLAVKIEGHADNVLPALFGGLVLASGDGWMRFEPSPGVAPIVLIAPRPFATHEARRVLPAQVPRADAVANAAATAALLAVLTGAQDPSGLMAATADRLHEPYRLPLMPETEGLHRSLRAEGVPAALSGAGPSVVALVGADELSSAVEVARRHLPDGWRLCCPGWDLAGARVA